MTRVDCIKCECGCGDYVSPNTYRKHLRQPRSARRRWRSKAAASPTFEESLATQAPPATSVNATQAPAPALLPFQAVCEEPRESRAFVEEVSVSTSSLTTTTLRSIRVHSASKHSLDDAEDVTPASDADAEDDAEDQIPSRTPRRRSARLRQRVCPPPPVVQEQLRRIQTPPSPADEETPHDELFDDFSFFLEGDAPSLPDSPPHLPAIDQQLSPADALALLVMILQRKNGITREAIEQFYLLLNTAVLHPDDPSTQSILFQTARKRVL